MLLGEVAKSNDDHSRQYFGNSWINLKLFYKQFDEKVIQKEAGNHQQKVT